MVSRFSLALVAYLRCCQVRTFCTHELHVCAGDAQQEQNAGAQITSFQLVTRVTGGSSNQKEQKNARLLQLRAMSLLLALINIDIVGKGSTVCL